MCKNMILAGHQLTYLPFIGLFHKIGLADKFIVVDHVQLNKKSWQNRNKIRTKDGEMWLTVPIITKGKYEQKISETMINNTIPWQRKHWRSIQLSYGKAKFFNEHKCFFERVYSKKWDRLADLDEEILRYLLKQLNIEVELLKSSDYQFRSHKTELLIEMCETFGVGTYISNIGSKDYVDELKFKERGLKHIYQDFQHPVYKQQYEPFIPNMSVIDLLFNCGPESAEIIRKSGRQTFDLV